MIAEDATRDGVSDKPWFPPLGRPLGAISFVRTEFPWLVHYFELPEFRPIVSREIDGVVSWGGRLPAKIAKKVSEWRHLPHWSLEDGFLRSVGLGKEGAIPFSIVTDDLGMAIDASRPSRLEMLIVGADDERSHRLGASIRDEIVGRRLSKYNHLPHRSLSIPRTTKSRILLVDQVFGDVSVGRAQGSRRSFSDMLRDALKSGAQCVVRTHPDVMAGHRKGYLSEVASRHPNVIMLSEQVSVASVLDVVDEVWTVSSQFGLDAMLRQIPVRCYAVPFYAGWGATSDHSGNEARGAIDRRRGKTRTVEQITAAAFSSYPVYRNPKNWQPIDVFQAMQLIAAAQHGR